MLAYLTLLVLHWTCLQNFAHVMHRREEIRERERLRQEGLAASADNLETPAPVSRPQETPPQAVSGSEIHRAYLSRP